MRLDEDLGLPVEIGAYENGEREGYWWHGIESTLGMWFVDWETQQSSFGRYQRGIKVGFWERRHSADTQAEVSSFVGGKLNGSQTKWWRTGQQKSEATWKDGEFYGQVRAWHSNGQLGTHGYYLFGRRVGIWREWDFEGNLIETLNADRE